MGRARLFQVGVPGRADPGAFGDVLAPQSRGAPPTPGRQSRSFRSELGAPGPQKLGELAPPLLVPSCRLAGIVNVGGRHGTHNPTINAVWSGDEMA